MSRFRVGLSRAFFKQDGTLTYPDFDLSKLERHPDVELVKVKIGGEVSAEHIRDLDAMILGGETFSRTALIPNGRMTLIARFGVGYNAVDIGAYFSKKIAKPITYTVEEFDRHNSRPPELAYSIEPIAVSDDNVLHALVTLKSRTIKSGTVKLPKQSVVSEVDVPIKDGDNITLVLLMAIAEADEAEDLLKLPNDHHMRRVYQMLQERLVEWKEDRPRPRM